jgi:hypothetical protein
VPDSCPMTGLFEPFAARAQLGDEPDLTELVEAVRAIPYRRPAERTPSGVVREWAGTCSTKHLLLCQLMAERFPASECRLVHRVYRVTRALARASFGAAAAAVVPPSGLLDVHTFATIDAGGRRAIVDVTFPGGPAWNGHSDMPLACGAGTDHDAGDDPMASKAQLVASYCVPEVREPFIAALSESASP